MYDTLTEYLDHWAEACPDETWLIERYERDLRIKLTPMRLKNGELHAIDR